MATLIWERRGRISMVLTLIALAAIAWVQTHKGVVLATSGGSAYEVPDVVNTSLDPNIVETSITAESNTVDLGPGMGGLQANVLTFNGTVPGPTFHLRVGQTVIVHFTNNLAHQTGIHWHGIELDNHSDGTPISQNQVAPGGSFIYKFKVTRPGIFWYHPHHHSSTNQVFKGLYGLIIVTDAEGDEDALIAKGTIPDASSTLPMVLSDLTVCKAVGQNDTRTYDPLLPHVSGGALANQAGPPPVQLCETAPIDEDGASRLPSPPNLGPFQHGDVPNIQKTDGSGGPVNEGQTTLTNGRQPGSRAGTPSSPGALGANAETHTVLAGQGLRLRLLNAATTRFFRLRLTDASGTLVPLVKIGGQGGLLNHAVIEGGVATGGFDTHFTAGELLLDPGDRIDTVLTIPASAPNGSVLTLWTEDYQRTGTGYANLPTVAVAHFLVNGTAPSVFTTTANTPLLTDPSVGKSVELLPAATGDFITPPGGENGMTDEDIQLNNNVGGQNLGINSVQGTHDFVGDFTNFPHPDSARWANLGDVLELTVTDTTAAHHPFHLHGFSMQPLELTKSGSPTYTYQPEFRDNIDIPPGYTLRFRIRLDDRAQEDGVTPGGGLGRWVFHCHIFFHASFGMISELDIVNKGLQKPNIQVICCVTHLNPGDPVELRGTWVDRLGQGVTFKATTLDANTGRLVSIGKIAPVVRTFGMSEPDTGTSTSGEFEWTYQPHGGEHQLVYLTITDAQGNTDQAAVQLIVNAPPAVTIRPASGNEGTAIPLNATVVDPEGSPVGNFHWTVAPSAGVDSGAACTIADPSSLNTSVTCNDDGLYALTLTASDGNATGTGTETLTVSNADPSVTITSPPAGAQFLAGSPVSVNASFADPGSNDVHTCTIGWGDGATTPGVLTESPGTCSGTHTYVAVAATRTLTVKVSDDDGGSGTANVSIVLYTARSLKQGVRDAAAAQLASASQRTAAEFRDIVRNVDESLDSSLWIDGNRLEPKHGDKVFEREEKAVDTLTDMVKKRDLPAAEAQIHIDALETADSILATGQLSAAIAASGIPREIEEARKWLARAAADRAAGRFEAAIEDYEHAWLEALEAIAPLHHHVH
jgi:FtsP/CotA-like multicopper oxidase with cupredoxin domain